jgi:hypothetical protein
MGEQKTVSGRVRAVLKTGKGVCIDDGTPKGVWYSNKFMRGSVPCNKGDEVELTVTENNGYWNLTSCRILTKKSEGMKDMRESKSVEMLAAYAKDLVVAAIENKTQIATEKELEVVMESAAKAVAKAYKTIKADLTNKEPEQPQEEEEEPYM